MFQFIDIDPSSLPSLADNDTSRRLSPLRTRRRDRLGIQLLLAAVLASLSGIAAAGSDPGYEFELDTSSQLFAAETFNGNLSRHTKLQPHRPGAMQVKLRLVRGSIGSYVYGSNYRPLSMQGDIRYCLTNDAQFGRNLRDGGQAARDRNDGPIVGRDGRRVEVLRYGDFEFVNADRDGDNIDLQIVKGGEENGSCVTVRVSINSTYTFFNYSQHTIETGDEIIFNVPSLRNAQVLADADGRIGVNVLMSLHRQNTVQSNRRGTIFASYYGFDHPRFGNSAHGLAGAVLGSIRAGRGHIAHAAPALELSLRKRSNHTIRADDPRSFDHYDANGGYSQQVARLADVTLREISGNQYASNGTRDFRLHDPHSNDHRLNINVTGPFTPGDRVFLDLNGDAHMDAGEEFRFNRFGNVATGSFNILQSIRNRSVYFVASRDHDINPGDYIVEAAYDFAYRSYRDVVANPFAVRINGHPSQLQLRQTVDTAVYAAEIFGDGSAETVLRARGMSTTLTVRRRAVGSKKRLRFELEAPAAFGEDIRAHHLIATSREISVVPGTGTAGSRSVEFNVDPGAEYIIRGRTFTFNIPSIRNAARLATPGATIGVTASIAHDTAAVVPPSAPKSLDIDVSAPDKWNFSNDSIFVDDTVIAASAPGFVFNLTMGDMAMIDPDNPAGLIGDPNVDTDSDGMNDTRALTLGTLVLHGNDGIQHDHDGGDLPIRTVDEVILEVQGLSLNEDDRIFIDLDGDRHIGQGETFAAVDGTPATTLTLAGADATTGPDGVHVYYIPGGTASLVASDYTLVADYEFGRADGGADNYRALVLDTAAATMETVQVDMEAMTADGYAYAIPGSDADSDIEIRIANRHSAPATVYVQGRMADGTAIGGSPAMIEIEADATTALTAARFEELFCGMVDPACWSGHASFRFFRSADDDIAVYAHEVGDQEGMHDEHHGRSETDPTDMR